MEYLPGGELYTLMRKQKKFKDSAARFYLAEVLLGIEYLHKGIFYSFVTFVFNIF